MSKITERLTEAIAGLPTTMDPYAPAMRQDVRMASTSEPASPDEVPEPEEPSSTPQPITSAPPLSSVIPPPPKPSRPTWEKFQLPNKRDIGFRRTDGFFLRIRKVESVPGKYLAQLWTGKEMLDKGPVLVPQGEDPIEHIKGMADSMLDDKSQRYEQVEPEIPEGEQPGLTAPEEAQPEQEQIAGPMPAESPEKPEAEAEAEPEEIAFDDEDFEITEEDLPRPE